MLPFDIGHAARVRALLVVTTIAAGSSLNACGGGGGGANSGPASVTLSIDATSTTPNGKAVALHATASDGAAPAWSLDGPGSLSADSGADVVYTPPATTPGGEATSATVTASTGGVSQQAVISLGEIDSPGHHWRVVLAVGNAGTIASIACGQQGCLGLTFGGAVVQTADGTNWNASAPQSLWGFTPATLLTVGPQDTFLASGAVAGVSKPDGTVMAPSFTSSLDGVAWMAQSPEGNAVDGGAGTGVIMAKVPDGLMAIDSLGNVLASPDGGTWAVQGQTGGVGTKGVAFGADRYVAMTLPGKAYVSVDGKAWTASPAIQVTPTQQFLVQGVVFDSGMFVAIGNGGFVATSVDGLVWDVHASATTSDLYAIAASPNGEIVAVGDNGSVETSADGVHWKLRQAMTTVTLTAVSAYAGGFYAGGLNNVILQSTN
jgi:hypothetical protein